MKIKNSEKPIDKKNNTHSNNKTNSVLTEKEKMLKGMNYFAFDKQLVKERNYARKILEKGEGILKTVGIICEYNPFHLGHQKQIDRIRQEFGPDTAVVCAMSGNFVQRGHPALVDKSIRAEAALQCGADLVLELPVTVSLSSAEGFAEGGVRILSRACDTLCFGAESATSVAYGSSHWLHRCGVVQPFESE